MQNTYETPGKMLFGTYPTPVQRVDPAVLGQGSAAKGLAELWVKRDDLTGATYGGNKVRKLEYLIADARARGATRLVTVGAVGSHHVLATTIYGRAAGFDVDAVLVPQPRTDHVVRNVRAGIGHGLCVYPASSYAAVPFVLAPLLLKRGSYFVMLGGSSTTGSMGYVDAARELALQVRSGELPEPDVIVVTLGSGGTAGGLVAGLEREGMRSRVLAVCVSHPWWFLAWMARRTARACLRRSGIDARSKAIDERLEVERRYIGEGYGFATEKGERATAIAARAGLMLDPTYTAKAFAAALDRIEMGRRGDAGGVANVLYWHTLSSAPIAPLLSSAPDEEALPPRVRRLLA